jgi:dTMP kinase
MKKNLFIALEGIDGSGKSTQIQLLEQNLIKDGHKVYTTFEPTKSEIGVMIRHIFAHKTEADHKTIAALFLADRLHHLLNKTDGLLKKMAEGYTVISDRYYFSSYAYHSVHMDMPWVINANKLCSDLLKPDLTIFIDIDPKESMQRINKNRQSVELYETLDNLTQVKNKYLEAFELLKSEEAIFCVNGHQSVAQIANDIYTKVKAISVK